MLHKFELAFICRYIGNEYGLMSVVKYESDEGKLMLLPYNISAKALEGTFCFFLLMLIEICLYSTTVITLCSEIFNLA